MGGGEMGGGEMGGGAPPPPPPAEEPAAVTPESFKKDNLNILLESEGLLGEDSYIDLSKARNSLGEIEKQLRNILKD
jgi:hypothetical protein